MEQKGVLISGHSHPTKHFGLAILINTVIFLVELIGGLLTNSLALISDAFHNLSDVVALILSFGAARLARKKSSAEKTYGYGRFEILAALINAVTLVGIGGYIIYEGIVRLMNPAPVAGKWMIIIAVVGFLANTASALLLRGDAKQNLNSRSAYLHLMTDAIESLGVIVVGILIYWKGWYLLDPLVSIIIGIFIIKSTWEILSETVQMLTEGTPKSISLHAVADFMLAFPGIENIHHLHIWSVGSGFKALSAHLLVSDRLISQGELISTVLARALKEKFDINHPTFQLESTPCQDQGLLVDPSEVSPKHNVS